MNSAAEISQALGGKKVGESAYKSRCPAHGEKTASLSIRQRGDKVLFHCFGCGAGFREIVPILESMGLWVSKTDPGWREKAKDKRRQEEIEACRIFVQVYDAPKNVTLRTEQDNIKYQRCRKLLK